jgi:SecD/SecF fusion protein
VIANVALLVNLLLLIALMSVFGFTLTLPGIAGIVLTMGMAVDSNVLIYERIREEWRNGRTALNAIETGFRAALATVIDANVTTGGRSVRRAQARARLAVTLAIGVLTTMYTVTVTRLTSLWVKRTKPKEVPLGAAVFMPSHSDSFLTTPRSFHEAEPIWLFLSHLVHLVDPRFHVHRPELRRRFQGRQCHHNTH